jgi:DNA-binding transcriptional ArsR family regulator
MENVLLDKRKMAALGLALDGRWHEWHAEVHWHAKSLRDVRANLLACAYLASLEPTAQVVLALPRCRISDDRLREEQAMVRRLLLPQICERVHLVWQSEGAMQRDLPEALPAEGRAWLLDLIESEGAQTGTVRTTATKHGVLGWLFLSRLRGIGFQSMDELCEAIGASYPTVAGVIKPLEAAGLIERGRGRSVALSRFPVDEWRRWLVAGESARRAIYFKDQSGQPRTVYALADRLLSLKKLTVAIGGVMGALHHYPSLDITAAPRLDLTMLVEKDGLLDLKFVRRLDAALKQCDGPDPSADLVIHLLPRKQGSFDRDSEGRVWADPVECMADLHEMRLDAQAQGMLHALLQKL